MAGVFHVRWRVVNFVKAQYIALLFIALFPTMGAPSGWLLATWGLAELPMLSETMPFNGYLLITVPASSCTRSNTVYIS